jgi:hypothetical protein
MPKGMEWLSLRTYIPVHCTSVLPTLRITVPVPNDFGEILPVQLYRKSTNINNSISRLTCPISTTSTLRDPAVETSPIIPESRYVIQHLNTLGFHSLYSSIVNVILLCVYLFQSPKSALVTWDQLTFGFSLTHLF